MRVAVLGCGLIGGSVGLALKQKWSDAVVVAYDKDFQVAERAVARGAADRAAGSAREAVAYADLAFLAAPVGSLAALAAEVAPALKQGAILTDVGSTKAQVVLEIERSLPIGVSFVGGHPMAGTENEGIDAATADLFTDAWWILTPTQHSDTDSFQRLHAVLTTLGARIMALAPDEHDRLMAVISHVPQLVATALMNIAAQRGKERPGLLALAAGGFRDVTRVAASNPDIWADICRENADAIAEQLSVLSDELLQLRDLVKRGSRADLRAIFASARESRRSLPGKAVEGDLYDVIVAIPDRPGVLAEVTATIGGLSVNIEDLQIFHSTEGGRGSLHISVVGERQAADVADALSRSGFDARATSR